MNNLLMVPAVILFGLGAASVPGDQGTIETPFGTLVTDGTCPEATHLLKYPCPGVGQDYYLAFAKNKLPDLVALEGTNVAVRGTLHDTTCAHPLIQVTKITPSAILPPCPSQ